MSVVETVVNKGGFLIIVAGYTFVCVVSRRYSFYTDEPTRHDHLLFIYD